MWSKFCLKFNTGDVETLYAAFGPPSEQDMMDKVSAMVTLHEKPRRDLRLAVSQLPTIRFFDQIIYMFAANAVNVFLHKELDRSQRARTCTYSLCGKTTSLKLLLVTCAATGAPWRT